MSKRPRDEASIASMQMILGDQVPTQQIENLLYRANYNVENALNLYFTDSTSTSSSDNSFSNASSNDNSGGSSRITQQEKYFIGEIVVTGWSLIKGFSPVKEGDRINIVREKVSNFLENKIIRFTFNGREVGRLPKDVAGFMATLIDLSVCHFEGSIVWSPRHLKTGEDMILSIQCYLLSTAMHTDSFMLNHLPKPKRKPGTKTPLDMPTLRKLALIQLFKTLGMRPVRSALEKTATDMGDKENRWDMILQTISAKEDGGVKDDDTKESDELLEDDEKKEVTDDQLDTIYEKAQLFDAQIMPMEPPNTMALELKEYQKRALAWMTAKEAVVYEDGDIDMRAMHPLWDEYALPNECSAQYKYFYFNPYSSELSLEFPEANSQDRGGILADEMGLGKTIEILSLIHTNRFNFKDQQPELLNMASKKNKSPTTLVICPMSLLAQWRDEVLRGSKLGTVTVDIYYGDNRSNIFDKLCKWDGSAPDVLVTTYGVLNTEWQKMQGNIMSSQIYSIEFWRVVIDEAHQIKNRITKTSQACRDIKATRRWAVTGTPIQNKLDDLYSLVRFLHHEPWANHTFWRTFITVPFERQDPRALSSVQTVLEPIVLRRTKAMRDRHGQPMVPLPPKEINIEYLEFTREEQDIYDAIYNDSHTKFSYFCQAGKIGNNYASIFQLLTRLRQICCHPYLVLQSKESTNKEVTVEGDKVISLESLIKKRSVSASNTNDSTQSSSELYNNPGSSSYGLSVLQNMLAIEKGPSSSSQMSTFSTDETDVPMVIADECPICFEPIDTMIAMPCMHMACRPCVLDYFQKKEDEGAAGECPVCRHGPIAQSELLEIAQQQTQSDIAGNSGLTDTPPSTKTIKFDIRKAVGGFRPSTKINALVKHLHQNAKEGLKTVVFSQFTSYLDLIGQSLEYENISFARLDGTLSQSTREKILSEFANSDLQFGKCVLLISLRAGGVGLNLTCANRVIMMDPWWNFAIEAQAIDRVHRLGQLKDVVVTRFIMKNTVEERILEIQNRKHDMVNELYMSRNQAKNRRLDDLQLLFSKK